MCCAGRSLRASKSGLLLLCGFSLYWPVTGVMALLFSRKYCAGRVSFSFWRRCGGGSFAGIGDYFFFFAGMLRGGWSFAES